MTNYVKEAVAKVSKTKQLAIGVAAAGILACGSVGAVSALSVGNNHATTDRITQSTSQSRGSVAGTFDLNGGLQGSNNYMQGGSYRNGTATSKQSSMNSGSANLGVQTNLATSGQNSTSTSRTTNGSNGTNSGESNSQSSGSANLGVGLNAGAQGQSSSTDTTSRGNDGTSSASSSSESGSANLGLNLDLDLQGSGSNSYTSNGSYNDGLLGGGLLGL